MLSLKTPEAHIYQNNIAVHTFELRKKINYQTYTHIFNHLASKYQLHSEHNTSDYYFIVWRNITGYPGVGICLAGPNHYIEDKYFSYSLRLFVNPLILTTGRNLYLEIFKPTTATVDNLINKLNNLLSDIKSPYTVDDLNIYRIDYCLNLIFDNPLSDNIVNCYLDLLTRGNVAARPKMLNAYNNMKKHHTQFPNCTKFDYDAFSLTAYNKTAQMLDINEPFPDEFLNKYLRIELSAHKTKAQYIYNSNRYTSLSQLLLNSPAEAKKQLTWHLTEHFQTGYYLSYNNAKKYIENCRAKKIISSKDHALILAFVELVSKKQSIFATINSFTDVSVHRINHLLYLFDKIKLNPVTIPRRWFDAVDSIKLQSLTNFVQLPD